MHPEEKLILFLRQNLISADQAAQELEVSKATLMAWVKKGKISAVYQRPNACLFLQQTIKAHKRNTNKLNSVPSKPRFHIQGTPLYKVEDEIVAAIGQMGRIKTIHVYFNHDDAVLDGFYYIDSDRPFGGLDSIRSARMILIDEYGEQLWAQCGTAGYGGTGPHDAEEIMRLLPSSGLIQVPPIPEEQIQKVFRDRVVKYDLHWKDETWQCFSQDSYMDPRKVEDSGSNDRPVSGSLYSYQGNLVLIGGDEHSWSDSSMPKRALQRYKHFIPSPVSYIYYPTQELAIKANRFAPYYPVDMDFHSAQAFQLIIQDKSGRELWLAPDIEKDKGITRQNSILELLELAGFDVSPYRKPGAVLSEWMTALLAPNSEEKPIRGFK